MNNKSLSGGTERETGNWTEIQRACLRNGEFAELV